MAAPYLAAIENVGASIRAAALRGLNKQQSMLGLLGLCRLRKMRENLAAR